MDTNQPTPPVTPTTTTTVYVPTPSPGMFGTKIPSTIAFAIGILLFFLPFSELKCGGQTIANKSGLDYALAKDWKVAGGGLMGNNDLGGKSTSTDKMPKGNTQILALAAAGLGILGLLLALAGAKAGGGGIVTGVLSAGALIALMIDEKKNLANAIQNQAVDKAKQGADSLGFDQIGNSMNDVKPVLSFAPCFYIAILAFLAAAFFCYKRMSAAKS